ncbi:MAG: CPBP family glutamic-type intramembrane protease [Anaerolineae bacterium]
MTKETRYLLLFFVLTFVWTWLCYAPMVISGGSPYEMPWMILLILGGAGPSIVGLALVGFTYTPEQRRDYWRRCINFRAISLRWWALILLVMPAIMLTSVFIDQALGAAPPGLQQLRDLIANPLMLPPLLLLGLLSGPVSEEFGWRGYALDPLINRWGLMFGSLLLGLLWGLWHLPLFFMPATWHGQMGFQLAGFWTFVLMNVGLAFLMTWVYRSTQRSIITAIALHFMSNFTANLFLPVTNNVEMLRAVLLFIVGVSACLLLERRAPAHSLQRSTKPT